MDILNNILAHVPELVVHITAIFGAIVGIASVITGTTSTPKGGMSGAIYKVIEVLALVFPKTKQ